MCQEADLECFGFIQQKIGTNICNIFLHIWGIWTKKYTLYGRPSVFYVFCVILIYIANYWMLIDMKDSQCNKTMCSISIIFSTWHFSVCLYYLDAEVMLWCTETKSDNIL